MNLSKISVNGAVHNIAPEYGSVSYTVNPITASGSTVNVSGMIPVHIISFNSSISSVILSANPIEGHSCHIIFHNTSADNLTVDIAHDSTNRICPDPSAGITLTVKPGGYSEVDFLCANGKVYVRGI